MTEPKDYKATLNLPRTDFPMKADLARREPARLEAWEKMGLEARRRAAGKGKPLFILHDGPPYANGNIHLGHVMNKTLKDFVARSRAMMGFDAPYVPGWDCHGLPIEQKVDKKLGSKKREMDVSAIRAACREYAQSFIDIQREEFKRLGVAGLWDRPYSTMSVSYEAETAWTFGEFYKKGLVFQDLKSVRWCFTDQTALAEAELEYEERDDPAIYVRFPFADTNRLSSIFNPGDLQENALLTASALAWTTTPWTIPSNVAIAVHPEESYILASDESNGIFVVAEKLQDSVAAATGLKLRVHGKAAGSALVGLRYRHPLPPEQRGALTPEEEARSFRVVAGTYVTMDTGTGLVHTAPGHGEDDFQTGKREGLPILSPVDEGGRYTAKVVKYQGKKVLDANPEIVLDLRVAGALLHEDKAYRHEYPHCWRCKRPVIFRATVQWFIRLDDEQVNVRQRALDAVKSAVTWVPAWGEQRMAGMVENRHEWLISRQRRWGSPITLLYAMRDGKRAEVYPWIGDAAEQAKYFAHVVGVLRKEGGDAWYARKAADFLPPGANTKGVADFAKETDILDVWFDSGVSHQAVLRSGEWPELARPKGEVPADIYVEGHDQHRGWFQSSLLTSVTLYGAAPYKAVLTHGFFFDAAGKKMSKSLGNVVEPQEMMKRYGADILRLWVCSIDYRDDGPISEEIVARCAEAYRKIRNTARYLISNLYDFDPEKDALPFRDLLPLDRRALTETRRAAQRMLAAYERFEFHVVYHTLVNLCGSTLSAFYLDILKDRLYASAPASGERRSAQTALHRIGRSIASLAAPVLPFTSEEIWEALPGRKEESVHLAGFETLDDIPAESDNDPAWDRLTRLREDVAAVLEEARRDKTIGSSLEAAIALTASPELEKDRAAVGAEGGGLADFFIVSDLLDFQSASAGAPGRATQAYADLKIGFAKARGSKCDRCWKITPEAEGTGLCARCRAVLATLPPPKAAPTEAAS